jgi:hypothetical protein
MRGDHYYGIGREAIILRSAEGGLASMIPRA